MHLFAAPLLCACGIGSPGTSATGDEHSAAVVSPGGPSAPDDGGESATSGDERGSDGDVSGAAGGWSVAPPASSASDCAPGEYVKAAGTKASDGQCAACEPGSFSLGANAVACTPWTVCASGYVEEQPGSALRDRTCRFEAWLHQFGTEGQDGARSVAVDDDESVYVAGTVAGALPGQTRAGGSYDAFVRKYAATGAEVWTRQFGSTDSDVAESVTVDGDGNVYVAGFAAAALPGQTNAGAWDAFVRKYDGAGNEVWTRQFGSKGYELGHVSVDAHGNVYVSGLTQYGLDPGANAGEESPTGGYLFARKYDAAGNELWTFHFGPNPSQYLAGFAKVDADGNLYFVGSTDAALSGQTNLGEQDAFVRKYASDGAELWTRQFGTSRSEGVAAAALDAAGNVYVVGRTFGAFLGHTSAGAADVFARKYDAEGDESWTRQFGTATPDIATAVAVDGAGFVYVGGSSSGTLAGQVSAGSTDAFVRKYDATGAELGTLQFGTAGIESNISLIVSGNGSLYVSGDTNGTFSAQTGSNPGYFDAFLAKLTNDLRP